MNLKHCIYILLGIIIVSFTSCLGDNNEETITYPKDAQLLSFQLTHDSLPALSSVLYTINQQEINEETGAEIYNNDSLPYGSVLPEKAVINFTTAGYAVILLTEAGNDSIQLTTGDSISITPFVNKWSKYLKVFAYDGTTKEYSINLRVHTIDPDSISYKKLDKALPDADEQKTVLSGTTFYNIKKTGTTASLSTSANAQDWTASSSSGFPANAEPASLHLYDGKLTILTSDGKLYYSDKEVTTWTALTTGAEIESVSTVLGEIKGVNGRYASTLALIVQSEGKSLFAQTDLTQIELGEEVPANFPVKDFASVSWAKNNGSKLLVLGGKTLSNEPSLLAWFIAGNEKSWNSLEPKGLKGTDFTVPYDAPNLFYYNNMLYLINGSAGESAYNSKVYTSIDGGLTWEERPGKYAPTGDYSSRNNASVCVDAEHYIYILGGKNTSLTLTDVWKGRQNRLGFK